MNQREVSGPNAGKGACPDQGVRKTCKLFQESLWGTSIWPLEACSRGWSLERMHVNRFGTGRPWLLGSIPWQWRASNTSLFEGRCLRSITDPVVPRTASDATLEPRAFFCRFEIGAIQQRDQHPNRQRSGAEAKLEGQKIGPKVAIMSRLQTETC